VQGKSLLGIVTSVLDGEAAAQEVAAAKSAMKSTLAEAVGLNHSSLSLDMKEWFQAKNLTADEKAELEAKVQHWMQHRRPHEDLSDGNVCADDEELFMKLCYKKCSLLTAQDPDGVHGIRTTAWSCCKSEPCKLANQKWTFPRPCSGFDTSGDSTGSACPHSPGACLADHELFLGVCYRRCALDDMAGVEFRFRMSPVSCCRSSSKLKCLLSNVRVNQSYALDAHLPNVSLTETVAA
jgi:hypothetical protein